MLTTSTRSSHRRRLNLPHTQTPTRLGLASACLATILLAACGGADEKPEPISEEEAVRFLAQASFGPTSADIAHLQSLGYGKWIDEQLRAPSLQPTHLQLVEASASARSATKPDVVDVTYSWWTHAIKDNAQLRQRLRRLPHQCGGRIFVRDECRTPNRYVHCAGGKWGHDCHWHGWHTSLCDDQRGRHCDHSQSIRARPEHCKCD